MIFPDDISNIVGLFGLINEMVGDIQRIIDYPALGYQINYELPTEIINSWKFLKNQGFT